MPDHAPETLDPHAPLSASERAQLQQHAIKKHDTAIILLHWFNASVWAIELATGGALFAGEGYRLAPEWWRELVVAVLGSPGMVLKVHVGVGLLWITVLAVHGFFGFRKYLVPTFRDYLMPDRDDFLWIKNRLLGILGREAPLPAQGIYNGGQKLFGLTVYAGGAVVVISGLIMAFRLGSASLVQWAILAHFLAVGAIFALLFVHVYMGAVLAEERPAFFSMFSGKVPELYAYRHHHKWWRKYKQTERAWREELEREATSATAARQRDESPTDAGSEADAKEEPQ